MFDPKQRFTVEQALEHEYLATLHGQMEEPLCHAPFDFEFERISGGGDVIPRADLQAMMFTEMQELVSSASFGKPPPSESSGHGRRGRGWGRGKIRQQCGKRRKNGGLGGSATSKTARFA